MFYCMFYFTFDRSYSAADHDSDSCEQHYSDCPDVHIYIAINDRCVVGCRLVTCFKDWFQQLVSCQRCIYSECSSSVWCGAWERCWSSMIELKWSSLWWSMSPGSTTPNSRKRKPYLNTSWMKRVKNNCFVALQSIILQRFDADSWSWDRLEIVLLQ